MILSNVSNFKTTLFADETLQLLVNQEINKVDEWL